MGKPNTPISTLIMEGSELTADQWISRLTEDANRESAAKKSLDGAVVEYDDALAVLCADAYLATVINKVDDTSVAKALGKTKVTVATWAMVGGGLKLPGASDGKLITKNGETYAAESVRHLRWAVNNALQRGHKAEFVRQQAGIASDRATFLKLLSQKSAAELKDAKEKAAKEEADKANAIVTRASILSNIATMLEDLADAEPSEADVTYIAKIRELLDKQYPITA